MSSAVKLEVLQQLHFSAGRRYTCNLLLCAFQCPLPLQLLSLCFGLTSSTSFDLVRVASRRPSLASASPEEVVHMEETLVLAEGRFGLGVQEQRARLDGAAKAGRVLLRKTILTTNEAGEFNSGRFLGIQQSSTCVPTQ